MISADLVRAITEDARAKAMRKLQPAICDLMENRISPEIESRANKGQYAVQIKIPFPIDCTSEDKNIIMNALVMRLEDAGYNVCDCTIRDGRVLAINWRNDEKYSS